MIVNVVQTQIFNAVSHRVIEGEQRSQQSVERVTGVVRKGWQQLIDVIGQPSKGRAADTKAAQQILDQLPPETESAMDAEFMATAEWGFDSAFQIWVDHLPAAWWNLAFADVPEVVLMESVEFNFPEPGGPGPTARSKKGAKAATIKVFGPPKKVGKVSTTKPKPLPPTQQVSPAKAAKVKAYTRPDRSGLLGVVRSKGWKSRMRKWSKKITDLDKVAELIARGKEKGWTEKRIVNAVKPYVQNYATSARRIVRTESARIENKMMESTYETFGDIIAGFQIINPLDERTRPTHAARAGRIYWKDLRKTPNADDRPELPDAPNCRCAYAPVLTGPTPAELANGPKMNPKTYAGHFNKLTDKEKQKIVGKDAWKAAKSKGGKPSWFDFVDPKTRQFIPADKLKKEPKRSTAARRNKGKAQAKKIKGTSKKSLGFNTPDEKLHSPAADTTAPLKSSGAATPSSGGSITDMLQKKYGGFINKVAAINDSPTFAELPKIKQQLGELHKKWGELEKLKPKLAELQAQAVKAPAGPEKKQLTQKFNAMLAEYDGHKALSEQHNQLLARQKELEDKRLAKVIQAMTLPPEKQSKFVVVGKVNPQLTETCNDVFASLGKITSKDSFGGNGNVPVPVHELPTGGRPFENSKGVHYSPKDKAPVVAHEMGHRIERNAKATQALVDFVDRRCGDEKPTSLRNKFGEKYDAKEFGRADKWNDLAAAMGKGQTAPYYVGKTYKGKDGKEIGTEVLSMGLEFMFKDPSAFAKADPEYFSLVMGVLRNDI